jgi:AraC-like DNA-binding protein
MKSATLREMRQGAPVRAGTYAYDGDDLVTDWHVHDLHQVEYAFEGVAEVETAAGHYLLPPQQAVWIPAGLAHQTTLRRVRSVSVFFAPELLPDPGGQARILAAAPVVREMILYATRWPIDRPQTSAEADTFFEVLANLVLEWLDHEVPLCLPTSADPLVAEVIAVTTAQLATITTTALCRAVGTSERTLRRRFSEETSMTWPRYLTQARLLRAMALLAESPRSITAVAADVGFENVSSFSRAFARFAHETPTAYRARVTTRQVAVSG